MDEILENQRGELRNRRYVNSRKPYRTGLSEAFFETDLCIEDQADGSPAWLCDTEFLNKYRMHRASVANAMG